MASAQCNRPANETCQQKCQGSSSLGQKMSGMAGWAKGTHSQQETKPSCQAPAQVHSCPNQGTCKAQTHQACHTAAKPQPHCGVNKASGPHHTHTHRHGHGHGHTKHQTTNGAASCHCAANKTNGRHNHNHLTNGGTAVKCEQKERNLFRRIKDRISGNSSCSDNSDSESDNECCHKRKN
ncbi:putative uncharacterized protein FLJ46204 [Morus notabilis]|uniref:putative uncharacterized protein FLJ46204 n=1 Tax=Morus notabilis TaxID=981085 RepID=UPI000CED6638|nr:putative uncharacterized protein FLJ46204 [Morus notabilis]